VSQDKYKSPNWELEIFPFPIAPQIGILATKVGLGPFNVPATGRGFRAPIAICRHMGSRPPIWWYPIERCLGEVDKTSASGQTPHHFSAHN
jgi:hypothetical protein